MSNYLNSRQTYLDSDFFISTAPATTYDTDLENFWTQSSIIFKRMQCNIFKLNNSFKNQITENFIIVDDGVTTVNEEINVQNQKYKVIKFRFKNNA